MYAPNLSDVLEAIKNDPNLGIYKPSPVSVESCIPMSNWSIRQVKGIKEGEETTDHLVGFNNNSYNGRVSSAIISFDPIKAICITQSGRAYHLLGDPGYSSDGEYVWGRWVDINGVKKEDIKDVTDVYRKSKN